MPITIHAKEQALSEVFSDTYAFSIPAYQRPYAWTREQASELLTDLLAFLSDDSEPISEINSYFLGSIVLIKQDDDPKADVVDGQQRLTTLTILLAVLRSLMNSQMASAIKKFIYQEGNIFEGIDNRYRLKLRAKDEGFFRKYIQMGDNLEHLLNLDASQLTDSQRNIQINTKYFIGELRQYSEKEVERFGQYLIRRCFLVVVSTRDTDSAYRIFSVLNARGLDLSLTDLLKSEIIGAIKDPLQQERYTRIWEDEEEDLGRDAFQELFAHIRMIYRKSKLRETALSEFRKHIQPQNEPQKFIDEVLKPYSDALEIIKTANYQSQHHTELINALFRWLNKIDNVDWIPPAILYFSKHSHTPDQLKQFFADLERLAAGLMILRADTAISSLVKRT